MSGIMGMLLGAKTAIAAAVDEFFNRVTLLLPGDGTNGAQNNTFLDSSSNNFTITRNGNTTQGTFSPFSQTGWSNYFDGSGDSLVTPSNSAFDPSGQNVTVDFFVYFTRYVAANNIVFEVGNSSVGDLQCNIVNTGEVRFTTGGNTGSTISGFTLNTWHYITCVKSGTNLTVYLNGTAGTTVSLSPNSKTTLYIGAQSGGTNMDGYISNFRYVRGSANVPSGVPTSPLTAITNTSLLTCQSNRFIDNSTNAFALTVNGNVSVQAFSPFAPTAAYSAATVGGSGYFDGTGDYLSNSSDIIIPSTGDFTAQFWVYPTQVTTLQYLIATTNNSGNKFHLYINSSAYVGVQTGSSYRDSSTTKVVANAWNHIACTRTGSTYALFVNGVSQSISGSGTMASTLDVTPTYIAARDAGTAAISGYLGSSKITTVVETISVPTAPYTSDGNTRLLTNFTNAGITDATANNDLETVGNAQISTTQSKFGGSSMYFDGTGDYLKGVYSPNMILSGDFTIECWINFSAHGNYAGIVSFANSNTANPPTSGWAFNFYSTTDRLYFETGTGFSLQATNAVTTNTWNHVAIVRSGSTITHYLNGTANGSGTSSATFAPLTTDNFVIGIERGLAGTITGYIDDLRITRYARYTANFTPPTAAFALQ